MTLNSPTLQVATVGHPWIILFQSAKQFVPTQLCPLFCFFFGEGGIRLFYTFYFTTRTFWLLYWRYCLSTLNSTMCVCCDQYGEKRLLRQRYCIVIGSVACLCGVLTNELSPVSYSCFPIAQIAVGWPDPNCSFEGQKYCMCGMRGGKFKCGDLEASRHILSL